MFGSFLRLLCGKARHHLQRKNIGGVVSRNGAGNMNTLSRSRKWITCPQQVCLVSSATLPDRPDRLCHTCILTRQTLPYLHTDQTYSAIPAYLPDIVWQSCIQTRHTLPYLHTDQTDSAIPAYRRDRLCHAGIQTRHTLPYLHTNQTDSPIPANRRDIICHTCIQTRHTLPYLQTDHTSVLRKRSWSRSRNYLFNKY